MSNPYGDNDIAIIGLAGRFPGASDVAAYWRNLREGVESLTELDDEELLANGVPRALIDHPDYVRTAPFLDGFDRFDAHFFGFSPREAAIMDPQHRHFLEVTWEALEVAGIDPSRTDAAIGVFAGSGHNAYLPYNLLTNPELLASVGFFLLRHTGNDKDFLTTRVSYEFDLKGPSVNVQTACSTSLVATHLACQSLLAGECDVALAGGVTIGMPHRVGYLYREGEVASSDGRTRPFDADATGTAFGSGAGAIVLKRAAEAYDDGDVIHAVVRGSAVNNDGSAKVSYLAPSVDAQAAVIVEALAVADVDPDTVGYIEAHGTGTPLGDPIEVAALTQAFRAETERSRFCALGSVKGNIGHLDTAAGVAGLIKIVEALKHRELPASLNFERPNPELRLDDSPFFVNDALRPWPEGETPRRAGITSLGVGGTNAHVVIEEAAPVPERPRSEGWRLLPISARTPTAAARAVERLGAHLADHPELDLADVAATLQQGRKAFEHRRFVVSDGVADAASALGDPGRVIAGSTADRSPSVAFMFAGIGAQQPEMGIDLYRREPRYREALDRALTTLHERVGLDLRPHLFPADAAARVEAEAALRRPSIALPALTATQLALASLWRSWGIEPSALIGHSLGEYAAAHVAGVFSLGDTLAIVAERGRLLEAIAPGSMVAISLSEDELLPLLGDDLDLAVINAPELCVVAGPPEAVADLERRLTADEIDVRPIHLDAAAHCRLLDPVLDRFAAFLARIPMAAPTLPLVSNLTGDWADPQRIATPGYWVEHLRRTVRFSDGVRVLLDRPGTALLEVGPGTTLSGLARLHPGAQGRTIVASMRHVRESVDDHARLLEALGRLWVGGVPIDWSAVAGDAERRRVALPTYPFERVRHWIEAGRSAPATEPIDAGRRPIDAWFERPSWELVEAPTAPPSGEGVALLLDELGFGEALAGRLRERGHPVIAVERAAAFAAEGDRWSLDPGDPEQIARTVERLEARGVRHLVHLWGLTPDGRDEALEGALETGFFTLFHLARALGDALFQPSVTVVTNGMQQVAGEALTAPLKALALGPVRVMPRELEGVVARSVDVALPPDGRRRSALLDAIVAELLAGDEPVVAYRAEQRYRPTLVAATRGAPSEPPLRRGGTYLITGGIGGIGYPLAEHLIRTYGARIALLGRTALPERDAWEAWLADHAPDDPVSQRLQKLRALEALGGELLPLQADVADPERLAAALSEVRSRFGALHGVFHTAGVLDDDLIGRKRPEGAAAVLAPKVAGTLALDAALADDDLDLLVLFSSTSALLGVDGQVDYTAANAFLDAYARAKRARDGTPAVAINWGPWSEVGMAARLAGAERPTGATGVPVEVTSAEALAAGERRFEIAFDPERDWLVDEHRTRAGVAVVPGTGYLALAQAALGSGSDFRPAALSDVRFFQPFAVPDGGVTQLQLQLEREGDGAYAFAFASGPDGEHEHVQGRIGPLDAPLPDRAPPADPASAVLREGPIEHAHMSFGQRWNSLRRSALGSDEALLELELPARYRGDLDTFALHPALLDEATGGALSLIPGLDPERDFFVPAAYGRLALYAPLPLRLTSHIRYRGTDGGREGTAVFDVTLFGPAGEVVAVVERFIMTRVGDAAFVGDAPTDAPDAYDLDEGGIRPHEGIDALTRVLAGPPLPQVVISPRPFEALLAALHPAEPDPVEGEGALPMQGRPDLATPFLEPRTDRERAIADVWCEVLGLSEVGVHDSFFDLGGHSLLLTQAVTRIRKRERVRLPLTEVFDEPTVARWAELADASAGDGAAAEAVVPAAEQGPIVGPVPLTPGAIRFLQERGSPDVHQWNLAAMLRSEAPVDREALSATIAILWRHHDTLRLQFRREGGGWLAHNAPPDDPVPLATVDLSHVRGEALRARIAEEAEALQRSLRLEEGGLLRVLHLRTPDDDADRVLMIVHHLAIDALSWTFLLGDFQSVYAALARGEAPPLPEKTTSYRSWAERLHEQARSLALRTSYWTSLPWQQVGALPTDHPRRDGANTNASARQLVATLDPEESALLLQGLQGVARPDEAMLAALTRALARWSGDERVLVEAMGHGRREEPGVDLSHSVGFYISYAPVLVDPRGEAALADALPAIARESAEMIALGVEHDLLRFVHDDASVHDAMAAIPRAEVLFNYLGYREEDLTVLDPRAAFVGAEESAGSTHSPEGIRYHTLAVKGGIVDGVVTLTFVFSQNLHRHETIERLAGWTLAELRTLLSVPGR